LGEFVKSASGKLADRWAGLGTALVFWAGLLVVWLWSHGGWARVGQASGWLKAQSDLGLLVVLLVGLLLAAVPALVVARVTTPVLRLLEGYWPAPAARLRSSRITTAEETLKADQAAFQQLTVARRSGQGLSREQAEEYSRVDLSLHHRPGDPDRLMPTRVGNVLRAAEDRPRAKYGLDSVIVWPRLWLVMPDTSRQELATARTLLDQAVAAVVWGILFAASTPLAVAVGTQKLFWLPTLTGVAAGLGTSAAAVSWWVPQRAEVFADLLDTAFDLYRFAVYKRLRWPAPTNPAAEQQKGAEVSKYLWYGSRDAQPDFTTSTPP
jgi:hypothetical protein